MFGMPSEVVDNNISTQIYRCGSDTIQLGLHGEIDSTAVLEIEKKHHGGIDEQQSNSDQPRTPNQSDVSFLPKPSVRKKQRPMSRWNKAITAALIMTIPEVRRQERKASSAPGDETDLSLPGLTDEKEIEEGQFLYNCAPPPIFMPIVTAAQIIVFIVYAVRLKNVSFEEGGVDFNSPLIYNPMLRYQVWRFVSYSLVHNGVIHLLTNSVFQLTLGTLLELQHKFWRIIPLYLIGVLSGSLSSSLVDPYTYLVGASGGVYALLGGHLATVLLNWKEMQKDWKRSAPTIILSGICRVIIVSVLVITDTGVAIYTRFTSGNTRVSFASHIGSLIAGALAGAFFLRNLKIRTWEKILTIVSVIVYLGLLVSSIIFNVICGSKDLCPKIRGQNVWT